MNQASEHRSDVLIVGAGPAGAAAGILLARWGIDVCVVDRARFPRPKPCGDALSNRAVRLVEDLLGGAAALSALPRAPVLGAAVIFPDGSRIERRYPDPGLIVPRRDLDLALRDRLLAEGARVDEGAAVRRLTLADDGSFLSAEGDGRRWRAGAMIAADGPGSVAWRALGLPFPRGRRLGLAATAYVDDRQRRTVSEHYLDPQLPCGYGWVFPAVGGLANVGVFQRADRYHRGSTSLRDRFDRFIDRVGIDRRTLVGEVRVWSLPLCVSPVVAGAGGLLLCGDAAALIDPLTGEGIWQALHSGCAAARIIAAARSRGEPVGRQWVRRYQRACARDIGWPLVVRTALQTALQQIVDHRLYRAAAVRGLLDWGYGRGSLEVSKGFADR